MLREKPQQGEVLAVGPGRRNDAGERIPVDVKVGDKVLYSKYGGTEVHYQGEDYLIVDALGGDPGVFSARYAGVHGDDAPKMYRG